MITGHALRGITVPVVTPVTADESVDHDGLRRVVRHMLAGGVHTVFALGGTGNFCSFTSQERIAVTRTVAAEVRGRVPLLVGCMDSSTRLMTQNVRAAAAAGADVVVVEPILLPLHDRGRHRALPGRGGCGGTRSRAHLQHPCRQQGEHRPEPHAAAGGNPGDHRHQGQHVGLRLLAAAGRRIRRLRLRAHPGPGDPGWSEPAGGRPRRHPGHRERRPPAVRPALRGGGGPGSRRGEPVAWRDHARLPYGRASRKAVRPVSTTGSRSGRSSPDWRRPCSPSSCATGSRRRPSPDLPPPPSSACAAS